MAVNDPYPDLSGVILNTVEENTPEGVNVVEVLYQVVTSDGANMKITVGSCCESNTTARKYMLDHAAKTIS